MNYVKISLTKLARKDHTGLTTNTTEGHRLQAFRIRIRIHIIILIIIKAKQLIIVIVGQDNMKEKEVMTNQTS